MRRRKEDKYQFKHLFNLLRTTVRNTEELQAALEAQGLIHHSADDVTVKTPVTFTVTPSTEENNSNTGVIAPPLRASAETVPSIMNVKRSGSTREISHSDPEPMKSNGQTKRRKSFTRSSFSPPDGEQGGSGIRDKSSLARANSSNDIIRE